MYQKLQNVIAQIISRKTNYLIEIAFKEVVHEEY